MIYKKLLRASPFVSAALIIGCNSEGAFDRGITTIPQISSIDVSYHQGTLISDVVCSGCEDNLYQYKWMIDDTVIGTVSTHLLSDKEEGTLRLEVIGKSSSGHSTTAYNIYNLGSRISHIYSNNDSVVFVGFKTDGTVVVWGDSEWGGDASGVDLTGIVSVVSNSGAVAAIKQDGSVASWGHMDYGADSSTVDFSGGISSIVASQYGAFAALKNDGSVVAWGNDSYGGDISTVVDKLSSGVVEIVANNSSFAALKSDGSVITWGASYSGGDSSIATGDLTSDVVKVFAAYSAYAALKSDGSVVVWGNYSELPPANLASVASQIKGIALTQDAYAALGFDGQLVVWGNGDNGGDAPDSVIDVDNDNYVPVEEVIAAYMGRFAVLRSDGSVISWGRLADEEIPQPLLGDVIKVYSAADAFAALKGDGSVATWGHGRYGADSSQVDLSEGVIDVIPGDSAFAALKEDGSVVSWGHSDTGGDSTMVDFSGGVETIFHGGAGFVALKNDGSVVAWGNGQTSEEIPAPLQFVYTSL